MSTAMIPSSRIRLPGWSYGRADGPLRRTLSGYIVIPTLPGPWSCHWGLR